FESKKRAWRRGPAGRPRPGRAPPPATAAPAAAPLAAPAPAPPSGLDFANSDLAFTHDHAIMGNFNGFTMYSVEDPGKARSIAAVVCPGGQGDVSIYGNLLFMSVEQTRGRIDCGTEGVAENVSAQRFRGVRS